jgi:hypothetical protein
MSTNKVSIFNLAWLTERTTGNKIARVINRVKVDIKNRAMMLLNSPSARASSSCT